MNKLITASALLLVLAACGQDKAPASAPAPASTPAPAAAAPVAAAAPAAVAAANPKGEALYKTTCAMCHASGTAGAPIPGKKDQWDARIAQGKEVLYKHAIAGFTGKAGMMPAKGGNAAAADEDVKAAVDFMLSK